MKLSNLKKTLDAKHYQSLIGKGLDTLRPPQELAIKAGLFDGKNMVIASPTASGKTLVAELAAFHNILTHKGKTLYIVPLKALASEKFNEFQKYYGHYTKIALSIGDFDSADAWLHKADLIITTSEKFDSLIRHNVPWLREIGTIVVDEVHMLDDAHRGPTLEVIITRLRNFLPKAQLIALSATISNAKELSDWLGAELIKSEYRPIELREGVYINEELDFGGSADKLKGKSNIPEIRILEDTLEKNKSMLLFVSSRRNAEGAAKKCLTATYNKLTPPERVQLEKLSNDILKVLESPTKQCEDLARCVKSGVAFHHAGLVTKQRDIIEDAFRERIIKLISATPTLAMGINLPSFRSVVRDLKRFNYEEGMGWIPTLEFKQMVGRAGRPGLEDHGEGIAIAKTVEEADNIFEQYINGEPEEIYSKLSVEPVLRMQILGLVATREIKDRKGLMEFFSKTFYAHQYQNIDKIESKLDKIMNQLVGWGFIKPEGTKIVPTQLGKRVSELYIDPYSASLIIDSFKNSNQHPVYYLHTICQCLEMYPLLSVTPKEFSDVQQKSLEFEDVLPEEPSAWDIDYEIWIKAFKTSMLLNDWINETSEARLMEVYRETPGILKRRLNNADWLIYSASEIAQILNKKEELTPLRKLRIRVKYGVKEELLKLLKFQGIGRKRARKLYSNNLKSAIEIKNIDYEKLSDLIGPKTAKKLKEQVEEKNKESQTKLSA